MVRRSGVGRYNTWSLGNILESKASEHGNICWIMETCMPFMKNVVSLLESTYQRATDGSAAGLPCGSGEESGNEWNDDRRQGTTTAIPADHLQDKFEAHAAMASPSPNHSEKYADSHDAREVLNDIATWRILHELSTISHQVAYLSHRLHSQGPILQGRHNILPKDPAYECQIESKPSGLLRRDDCERSRRQVPHILSSLAEDAFGAVAKRSEEVSWHIVRTGAPGRHLGELVSSLRKAAELAESVPPSGPETRNARVSEQAEQLWKQRTHGDMLRLTIGNTAYILRHRLGWGSHGVVFQAETNDRNDRRVVAIKFERRVNGPARLIDEYRLKQPPQYHAMTMIKTYSEIRALKGIHEREILHRDIKPENILLPSQWSTTTGLCLVDFGLSAAYKDRTGKHVPYRPQPPMEGTPRYTPLGGAVQSRGDDLVMALHVGVSLAKPLPWQGLKEPDPERKMKLIDRKKRETNVRALVDGLDPNTSRAFEYGFEHAATLNFDQEPQYTKLQLKFDSVLRQTESGNGQLGEADEQFRWLSAALAGDHMGPCPSCVKANQPCSLAMSMEKR
ncbi:hypothetical protein PCL_07427 [Purpureocillium lilacinum]|uniref:non-specific serine/threonine protein kinase n=1 Tax=Purpureocillium lilacinum TaxID=33203 RepID=A0A2U3DSA1_PURLI|nr:hypothetical protein PCL_07427 [Purpureocillium lilacinum]